MDELREDMDPPGDDDYLDVDDDWVTDFDDDDDDDLSRFDLATYAGALR
ncbi:MAG: hypothetical protein H6R10_438 [Rhodocyclaceae bacterium]|nr:hypothetical protein [Rhodocyclaceae bacterium]